MVIHSPVEHSPLTSQQSIIKLIRPGEFKLLRAVIGHASIHCFVFVWLGKELIDYLELGIFLVLNFIRNLLDAIIAVKIALILHEGVRTVGLLTSLVVKPDVLVALNGCPRSICL